MGDQGNHVALAEWPRGRSSRHWSGRQLPVWELGEGTQQSSGYRRWRRNYLRSNLQLQKKEVKPPGGGVGSALIKPVGGSDRQGVINKKSILFGKTLESLLRRGKKTPFCCFFGPQKTGFFKKNLIFFDNHWWEVDRWQSLVQLQAGEGACLNENFQKAKLCFVALSCLIRFFPRQKMSHENKTGSYNHGQGKKHKRRKSDEPSSALERCQI